MGDGPRISVIGCSGAGKTTVSTLAAQRLGVRRVELDALRHGPGWVETPDAEFSRLVAQEVARDAWVVEGNYHGVLGGLVRDRATSVVWLDPPRSVVMAQVFWRSFSRLITQVELWNGNRERWNWLDPEHPIRWAYSNYDNKRRAFEAAMDARWVRLRSRREMKDWLDSLTLP
jgi:adenylate kinase family enzyme